jgi:protease II
MTGAVLKMAPELYNGVLAAPFIDVVTPMLDIPLPSGT